MKTRKTAFYTVDTRDHALPVSVVTIGLNCDQGVVNRPAGHEDFHFFRCLHGQGQVWFGSHTCMLRSGMGMILFPGEPHHYAPFTLGPDQTGTASIGASPGDHPLASNSEQVFSGDSADSPSSVRKGEGAASRWMLDWITFRGPAVPGILDWLGIQGSEAFVLEFPSLVRHAVEDMSDIMHASRPTAKMERSCLMYKLLSGLYWSLPAGRAQSRVGQYRRLEPVLNHIDAHFSEPLTLEQLADVAGISSRHLCSLFQEILHVRPFWHLNEVRINRSKRLLIEDRHLPVSVIASVCGYPNTCYYNQQFKKSTGMSPTAFRAMH